ncbi:helix-turn-helix transcriptional regulator [Phyllobacterium sp. 0TCS1.6C]|uniref:helix-turn-helix domain-containing protein n=1 Tax=unclassified Phyllobacterium TaxID=2638441 RepID=UPI0022648FC7|nr:MULTISPECIES: helix-turn-helix transcriptional regulator [unclassified Phyllobacterium]MCX8281766.1 helix-turn-helix transcriptional regulator [Phyllobacterium sp. 0TCS1.6C]MCX8295301.1 helix-turn-helix transcriptional regulator [Phyllobacterium sp. 0TCS1.6A]
MQELQSLRNVGKRLSEVRTRLGISQIPFAETLGISSSAYKNYERGEREVPLKLIIDICEKYEVNPAWLILGKGSETQVDIGEIIEASVIATHEFLSSEHKSISPERSGKIVSHLVNYALQEGELTKEYATSFLKAAI